MTDVDFAPLAVRSHLKFGTQQWPPKACTWGSGPAGSTWGWARAALEPGAKMNLGSYCVPGLCRVPHSCEE